ncbi:putative holin [Iodobacter sp.]|uniref:putative holin n=1 Tax=Iodobacter sp. TaxID=1915058 RepID=UPI0025E2B25C|nr:putative holin [Iodobacter sp.]
MTEPVSTSYATSAVTSLAVLSLFPGIDAAIVLGAFAGAVVFVMTSDDLTILKRLAFMAISFIAGCLAAQNVASMMSSFLPKIAVSNGVGALVAAAISVRLLLWLIRRANDPSTLLPGKEK